MTTSEFINELAGALSVAQSKFVPVKKSKTAKVKSKKTGAEFTYHYADLADILQMALPILAAEGLSFSQLVESDQNKLAIVSSLMHKSGQWIMTTFSVTVPQEERMSEIQGMGSAITYLRRYTASAMLGISSEEDDDANAAGDTVKGNAQQGPANASSRPQSTQDTKRPQSTQPAQATPRQQPVEDTTPTPEQIGEIQLILDTLKLALNAGDINDTVHNTWVSKFVMPNGTFNASNLEARLATLKQAYSQHYQQAKANRTLRNVAPSDEQITDEELFDDDIPF